MKSLKFMLVPLVCFSLVASCVDVQVHKSIKGNGNVVKKERNVDSFDGIKVSTGIDVYLRQGDKEAVTVEADENLQEHIMTEVKGGVLHVYSDAIIRNAEKEKVYVTMKEIHSLKTSSAGDIYSEAPIKCEDLEIDVSSSGDVKLDLTAKKIEVDISSAGDVKLTGEADILNADLSSAGDLYAYDLKVREAEISVSSAGDAKVNVTEKITARASSAGEVTYKGDPKYVDAHSSSAGGIHKR